MKQKIFAEGKCECCGRWVYNPNHPLVTLFHLWRSSHIEDHVVCTQCGGNEDLLKQKGIKPNGPRVTSTIGNTTTLKC